MAYLWAVLSPHVASVHYGDNTTHIYTIILQLWSARLCSVCSLRCWHYAHLCHQIFDLTNGQVFALYIYIYCAAFADGTRQNQVRDFVFDGRCYQTF